MVEGVQVSRGQRVRGVASRGALPSEAYQPVATMGLLVVVTQSVDSNTSK